LHAGWYVLRSHECQLVGTKAVQCLQVALCAHLKAAFFNILVNFLFAQCIWGMAKMHYINVLSNNNFNNNK